MSGSSEILCTFQQLVLQLI